MDLKRQKETSFAVEFRQMVDEATRFHAHLMRSAQFSFAASRVTPSRADIYRVSKGFIDLLAWSSAISPMQHLFLLMENHYSQLHEARV